MGFNPRNMHVPRPREIRESFQPEGTSGMLLLGWLLSSTLAMIIPVSKWAAERNRYHSYYGQYNEYEQQQQQYENQANGNYNNYNGNGNGNNNYNGNGGYYNLCSWWNFKCHYQMRRYQQMYGNNGGNGGGQENSQMQAMLPGWYFFFGGAVEDDDRDREENGMSSQNNGSMKFVYLCTIVMFLGLSVFGFRSMYAGKDRMGVIAALLIFGMFSLMNLLTTVQGTIETDNRSFENSVYGWFGQWSVLVAYTDFWLMLHCFIFAGLLGLLGCLDKKAKRDASSSSVVHNTAPDASYHLEMGNQKEEDSISERQRY
mmetsp:Transcript_11598/g.21434  ORF Transcript_11598/g.21434 Transcript_11598/m.21434 type:complete len:314 (+) Transcript_11598:248-1189(+)